MTTSPTKSAIGSQSAGSTARRRSTMVWLASSGGVGWADAECTSAPRRAMAAEYPAWSPVLPLRYRQGTRLAAPEIAFDLTPLQNAHRYRGIGTYVRGLAQRLAAQTEIPIEFWSWEGAAPIDTPPPHTSLAIRRPPMPQYRGAWLFARFG